MKQLRAINTRQSIIDSAVELFAAHGYGEVALTDIVKKAKVTTGGFYHHFGSKRAVAEAVIEQGWPRAVQVLDATLTGPGPGLENVITMTYALSALMKRDPTVWVANHLNQAFGELSEEGRDGFRRRASTFVARVSDSLNAGDLRDCVTNDDVANLVWIHVHGCHLLSDAMNDDVIDRLTLSWTVILAAVAPDESRSYFEQFVKRAASRYS